MRRTVEQRRISWSLFALLLALLLPGVGGAQPDVSRTPKRVVVLYWYNMVDEVNRELERGFKAGFRSGPDVEFYSEYLESNQFRGERQTQALHDYLRQKYHDIPIDVAVAFGDATFDFLGRFRHTIFPQASVVFMANASLEVERRPGPGITGIAAYRAYRSNIDLILRLQPQTKNIFIISGTMSADRKMEMVAREQLANDPPRVAVSWLTDLPMEELVRRVSTLPPRSVVLYTMQQLLDDENGALDAADVLSAIARVATVPIYGMSAARLGQGILGGELHQLEATGKRAAELTLRILNGASAEDIPVEHALVAPMFDWRELQRWQIPESRLPAGSIVQFRDPTTWDRYRWYILAVLAVCAIQAALIAALLFQRASRQRAERQALSRQRELTHLSRVATVGELTGAVAHEIGQPLMAILANAQAGRRMLVRETVDREALLDTFDDIIHDNQHASEVINRLRRLLRRNEMASEDLDLNDVVRDAISLSANELAMRSVTVATVLAPDLPAVAGDRVELQQVLLNLILNGSEAISELPAEARVLTIKTETTHTDEIAVSVRDSGHGLKPDAIEGIFTPFYTTRPDGLGLGLAICRRIIAAHGGRIWAENNDGPGATVTFSVPMKRTVSGPARTLEFTHSMAVPQELVG